MTQKVIEEVVVTAPRIKIPDISIDIKPTIESIKKDVKRDMKARLEADMEAMGDEVKKQVAFNEWMKPKMSIDRLRFNMDSGARANRFNVDMHCGRLGLNLEGLRCMNATFPGRQLETADWSAYGPTQKMPYQVGNDGGEVTFTFLCDSTFADRLIIDAWLTSIFAPTKVSQETADLETADPNIWDRNAQHPMFGYMNDYAGEVKIQQFTKSGKKSLAYKLWDAYPVSFAPMTLSWTETDSIMAFECTFAFRTFTTVYSTPPSSTALNRGRRALDAILDIGNLRKGGNSSNNTLQRFNDRLAKLDGLFG